MNALIFRSVLLALGVVWLIGCGDAQTGPESHDENGHPAGDGEEAVKGPHGGRLLTDGDFALELAIFESGVPPEFRVWVTEAGVAVAPVEVDLHVTLTRLGDVRDEIDFTAQNDFLRGNLVIYEPHSFVVTIEARRAGVSHRWEYENFEGRTRIEPGIAKSFGLETELAGPATIREAITVYGRIVSDQKKNSQVSARFEGVIESVAVSLGDAVVKGQQLARVESNESLRSYTINAPIGGVVGERAANPGEQTGGRRLFTILDTSTVWAELAVFPADRSRVQVGAPVAVQSADGQPIKTGQVGRFNIAAEANQSVLALAELDNSDRMLVPGMYVVGEILVAEHGVPLAVKRSGLQSFRDFTVVYALTGDEYEVRMLELGRQDAEQVEVLGGLEPGIRYVTTNSYLVKADIEKSGASHDH